MNGFRMTERTNPLQFPCSYPLKVLGHVSSFPRWRFRAGYSFIRRRCRKLLPCGKRFVKPYLISAARGLDAMTGFRRDAGREQGE